MCVCVCVCVCVSVCVCVFVSVCVLVCVLCVLCVRACAFVLHLRVRTARAWGPRSQFVVSGSDCGNVFVWDAGTGECLQCLPADSLGAINSLAPHPHGLPLLAVSGLENDAKVLKPGRKVVRCAYRRRS